ncbi:MAG: GTP pyrophosphokinase [Brucella sp.]
MTVEDEYRARYEKVLLPLSLSLSELLTELLSGQKRIDRISARAKSIERFVAKAGKLTDQNVPKYENPLAQIQDQIGARVTVFYKSDVESIREVLMRYLRPVESRELVPASEWEFGYFGWHSVCLFPAELILPDWSTDLVPNFFEIQVKTLFQHAWSEANHDLGYKPESDRMTSDQNRLLAFASAQAWGADRAFDELFSELHRSGKHS